MIKCMICFTVNLALLGVVFLISGCAPAGSDTGHPSERVQSSYKAAHSVFVAVNDSHFLYTSGVIEISDYPPKTKVIRGERIGVYVGNYGNLVIEVIRADSAKSRVYYNYHGDYLVEWEGQ